MTRPFPPAPMRPPPATACSMIPPGCSNRPGNGGDRCFVVGRPFCAGLRIAGT